MAPALRSQRQCRFPGNAPYIAPPPRALPCRSGNEADGRPLPSCFDRTRTLPRDGNEGIVPRRTTERADARGPVRLSPDCPVSWNQSPARSLRVTTPLEVRPSALLPAAVQHLTTLMKGFPPLRCCPPSSGHYSVWLSPRPRPAVGGVGDVPPRRGRLSGVSTRFRLHGIVTAYARPLVPRRPAVARRSGRSRARAASRSEAYPDGPGWGPAVRHDARSLTPERSVLPTLGCGRRADSIGRAIGGACKCASKVAAGVHERAM